ncbi:RHS repeat-associated core domain protein [Leifsonia aquatica ATCC 14665]|uniref:RHS repeat-associated core domain protein n=1 Tax=Leifsonia aquatica ATCC 14665 TaxID=1358026 RepID=U2RS32_LEIAQ|nr:RHS repeat-associated core domain protein [Leifsonia aquatica ATCC 14665]
MVRDAAGSLAEHVSASGEATWDLLDGLGSTIAGVTAGSITQLTSYDDWGAQAFETEGWSAPEGYTGHAQDATQGLIHTFARSYDVATGTWTTPDTWRGLLTQPKSLARHQYAAGNPTTNWDPDGHLCAKRGSTDALPLGCGAPPHQAWQKAGPPPPTTESTPTTPASPSAGGPNDQNDLPDTHGCPEGKVRYISPYVSPQCVDAKNLKDSEQRARLWLECNKLCGDAWIAFIDVVVDGIGVVPGLVLCGTSLPVGGGACINLDPQDVASFLDSLYGWQDAEYELWADQLARWRS